MSFLDPSSPFFFPQADFLHETCNVVFHVIFSEEDRPSTQALTPSLLAITESGARAAWAQMRETAASIVEECVDVHQTGSARDRVDDGAYPGLTFSVYITRMPRYRSWIEDQTRAMAAAIIIHFGFPMAVWKSHIINTQGHVFGRLRVLKGVYLPW